MGENITERERGKERRETKREKMKARMGENITRRTGREREKQK